MKAKLTGLSALLATAFLLSGCNEQANDNANMANSNRAMNSNVAVNSNLNSNANVNSNTRTGTAPTREEYEKNREQYQREAKQSGRTVGTGLNDGWLWVKAKYDLAAANDLRDSTINVDVDNAVVTLSGTVASATQKAKAEQVAKAVEGVKGVKDMLKVVPDTNSNTVNKNLNSNVNRNVNHK